jgi:hypothetical protein
MAKKNEQTDEVFLSEIDPADGSKNVKPEIMDGTDAAHVPEAPVDPEIAAKLLAQREWEREQGKLAENPDN